MTRREQILFDATQTHLAKSPKPLKAGRMLLHMANCLTCIQHEKSSYLQLLHRIVFSLMQDSHPRTSLHIIICCRASVSFRARCLGDSNELLNHSCLQKPKDETKVKNGSTGPGEELRISSRERTLLRQEPSQTSLQAELS